ncbi:putative autophagy-related protein [Clavispora lusitaniae]|uniref:Autophagy-related protein n=1 Tax=Clavispora lusitaniae TaxID=36911 RepID=A0ACD0WK47_CLALS|nr:putative autophagy-related protein [Clavispora lusitaniae]QFZ33077.1 putative autophagy-related protein [Clavispora lusitaniae]QFZ38747.1 putative autophagy-related protein [Clavispora lusitaniae]QFZ44429.1 putative autophagy-related protein [Clavispora lusitaniae]QFZ50107.1 putative autophagy-related protein [Clavispora lusitaniae]
MSDSIDRVFRKAITTIRALSARSAHGSLPRPPAENRIRLYGLYKQATEGDVVRIMPRPEGYTLDDDGARRKWDAWKQEEGLSRTEAKRRYISCLIETMRVHASGTPEARELLAELEYLWDQIKNAEYSDEEPRYAYNSALDQSDRLSTGTMPWPGSSYAASVAPAAARSVEQMYSHSRRARAPEDWRTWQGEINSIVSKLSRAYVPPGPGPAVSDSLPLAGGSFSGGPLTSGAFSGPGTGPEEDPQSGDNGRWVTARRVSACVAVVFLAWCLKRNVRVALRRDKPDELVLRVGLRNNRWLARVLSRVNGAARLA